MHVTQAATRPAAVAGFFYPAAAAALVREVDRFLADARAHRPAGAAVPKAIIVPHAGFPYSGPVAASAYAWLEAARQTIRRVVLFGPAHREFVTGLAVPGAAAFDTPLGPVAVDRTAVDALRALPFVQQSDSAHAQEHCLEVQLPFLLAMLDDFELVPAVVGGADGAQVAQALETVWGGPETLIVISSDLSHYLSYDLARQRDKATCRAIETGSVGRLTPDDACGAGAIDGLLRAAPRHGLTPTTVDLRNSGDTAGPRGEVVGYGAWVFTETGGGNTLSSGDRDALLQVAGRAVRHAASFRRPMTVATPQYAASLRRPGASFVTVEVGGDLRGCIGTLDPHRPLVDDVAAHAYAAACEDGRFAPLRPDDLGGASIDIAVLGAPEQLRFSDEADLVRQIRPGIDGLILTDGPYRGTFLPKVWDSVAQPAEFLTLLKTKAGLPRDHWSGALTVQHYTVESFGAPLGRLALDD